MLMNLAHGMRGFRVRTQDGVVGRVHDVIFSRSTREVTSIVVETRLTDFRQRLVVDIDLVDFADAKNRVVVLGMDSNEIHQCRKLKDMELALTHRNRLRNLWEESWALSLFDPDFIGGIGSEVFFETVVPWGGPNEGEDSDLCSGLDIVSTNVYADGSGVGRVYDWLLDDETWQIEYLVLSLTSADRRVEQVLVRASEISAFEVARGQVRLNLHREFLDSAPHYDESKPLTSVQQLVISRYFDACHSLDERFG